MQQPKALPKKALCPVLQKKGFTPRFIYKAPTTSTQPNDTKWCEALIQRRSSDNRITRDAHDYATDIENGKNWVERHPTPYTTYAPQQLPQEG